MNWRVELLDGRVERELLALPADMQARYLHVVELLEAFGPHAVGMPHVRPLEDALWEMRLKGRDGIARAIYLATAGRRIVVLHAFVKKSRKTPRRAIRLARQRRQEAGL